MNTAPVLLALALSLPLATLREAGLRVELLQTARTQLKLLREPQSESRGDFRKVERAVAQGISLDELGLSSFEWRRLTHECDVREARQVLEQARKYADQEILGELGSYFTRGVTLSELSLTEQSWRELPETFKAAADFR